MSALIGLLCCVPVCSALMWDPRVHPLLMHASSCSHVKNFDSLKHLPSLFSWALFTENISKSCQQFLYKNSHDCEFPFLAHKHGRLYLLNFGYFCNKANPICSQCKIPFSILYILFTYILLLYSWEIFVAFFIYTIVSSLFIFLCQSNTFFAEWIWIDPITFYFLEEIVYI